MRDDSNLSIAFTASEESAVQVSAADFTAVPIPAAPSTAVNSLAFNIAFHTFDFAVRTLVTTPLIGELFHQIFEYRAPSKEIQRTWLGFVVIAVAALSNIIVNILNYSFSKKNSGQYLAAENYLFALLSGARLFYTLSLFLGSEKVNSMPLSYFIAVSPIGLPIIGAFFMKMASPDSSDQFIIPWSAHFNPPRYIDASVMERRLNGFRSGFSAAANLMTFLWVINREVEGETVPLEYWQMGCVLMFLTIATKIGYELTHHPKFYQGFAALLKLLDHGSLIYAAYSGIFQMAVAYQCPDKDFCLDQFFQDFLSYACFFLAAPMGLFSAAKTKIPFEKEDRNNKNIISKYENAKNWVAGKSNSLGNALSNCWENRRSLCCDDPDVHENSSLLPSL